MFNSVEILDKTKYKPKETKIKNPYDEIQFYIDEEIEETRYFDQN